MRNMGNNIKDKMVNSVIIQGEKVDLHGEMSVEEATNQLKSFGFGDLLSNAQPTVTGTQLSFTQENATKG